MAETRQSKASSVRAWTVLMLTGLAGMLFYMDRQLLSVLKTTLKAEMGWTDTDYGWLVSAFMLCYTSSYLFTGHCIDLWGTRRTMPVFIGMMSAANILAALSHNLGAMGVSQALLGLAGAGVMPASLVAIFAWFKPGERGMATTFKGPFYIAAWIITTPMVVFFVEEWGWHMAFLAPGIFGLIVAGAWWQADRLAPSVPTHTSVAVTPIVSYRDTLRRRELWGVLVARLVSDPLWYVLIYWEPGFLQERIGMSLTELGKVGWIPTAISTVALMALGLLSDFIINRFQWTPERSRRVILQSIACLAPALLGLWFTQNHTVAIILLSLVRVMCVTWLNFTNIFIADLVPQNMIGTAVGLISAVGAAGGLICNALVGPTLAKVGYGAILAAGLCLHPLAACILWRCYGSPTNRAKGLSHARPRSYPMNLSRV